MKRAATTALLLLGACISLLATPPGDEQNRTLEVRQIIRAHPGTANLKPAPGVSCPLKSETAGGHSGTVRIIRIPKEGADDAAD